MNSPKRFVVESNIPSAEPNKQKDFGSGQTVKQRREQEDITAWMQMQEDAELEFLTEELAGAQHRANRQFLHD